MNVPFSGTERIEFQQIVDHWIAHVRCHSEIEVRVFGANKHLLTPSAIKGSNSFGATFALLPLYCPMERT